MKTIVATGSGEIHLRNAWWTGCQDDKKIFHFDFDIISPSDELPSWRSKRDSRLKFNGTLRDLVPGEGLSGDHQFLHM